MRSKTVTAACGLAFAVAAASPAFAASLEGLPFAIDKTTANQTVLASMFATGGANFAVSLGEDTTGDQVADTVSLQLFKAKGKPDGKKAEVVKAKAGPFGPGSLFPAGGMQLSGGEQLVGYASIGVIPQAGEGGVFAQAMKNGKKSGKELELDAEKARQVAFGTLVPLETGGFASWSTLDFMTAKTTAAGRFVSAAGKVDKAVVDLTRPNSQFAGVHPFLDGFIAQWLEIDRTGKKATVFARIYDSKAKPLGPEQALTNQGQLVDVAFTAAIGLKNGQIAVLTSAKLKGGGAELVAQLYDKSWKKVGKEKTLVKEMLEQPYAAHPLPDGGLLIGAKLKDGARDQALAITTFNATLKSVGPTARIAGVSKPDFSQLLVLENGDAVLLYTSNSRSLTGQLIKP